MVLWVGLICSQIWVGFEIVSQILKYKFDILCNISLAIPFGISFSLITFFFSIPIFGQNMVSLSINIALCIALSIILSFLRDKSVFTMIKQIQLPHLAIYTIYLVISAIFVQLIYFQKKNFLPTCLHVNLHEDIAIASSFYSGCNSGFANIFRLNHPDNAGSKIVSRWIVGFYSSMLRIGFASLHESISIPSALFIFSILSLMFCVFNDMGVHILIGSVLSFLPFIVSGFGIFSFLNGDRQISKTIDFVKDVGAYETNYTHILLTEIIGSRTNQMAISIVLSSVFLLYYIQAYENNKKSLIPSISIGLISGLTLPGLNQQSYMSFLVFIVLLLVFSFKRKKLVRKTLLILVAFISASSIHIPRIFSSKFWPSHKVFIWNSYTLNENFFGRIGFWWNCFGALPFIVIISSFVVNHSEFYFYFPYLTTFFAIHYIGYKSNISIFPAFVTFYLPIGSLFYGYFADYIMKRLKNESKGVFLGMLFIMTISFTSSSVFGFINQLSRKTTPWNDSSFKLTSWILKNTKKSDIFVSQRTILDPVSCLCGRSNYVPHSSIASKEGYAFLKKEIIIREFLKTFNSSIIPNIKYILLSSDDTTPKFDWKEVYSNYDFRVFERRR